MVVVVVDIMDLFVFDGRVDKMRVRWRREVSMVRTDAYITGKTRTPHNTNNNDATKFDANAAGPTKSS